MYFLSGKIVLILAKSADLDEMLPYAAFHLGLHCLPKYMSVNWRANECLHAASSNALFCTHFMTWGTMLITDW